MATKWGIASAGKISSDFVTALRLLPSEEHVIVAVAARDKDRAKAFAEKHNIPVFYGSYEELAADKDVEVIYIGMLNPQHISVGQLCLEHGKHILCEKPLGMNLKEVSTLIKSAQEKKLFLMEAVWTRCFPLYDELRQILKEGVIGEPIYLSIQFGSRNAYQERFCKRDLGGSSVLDLGVYTLQLALLLFGGKPTAIKAAGHLNSEGIDESMSCVLTYPGGKTACLSTHGIIDLPNTALIIGTKGKIEIGFPFWCPTKMTVCGEEKEFPIPKGEGEFVYTNSSGLHYEAAEVRRCLKQGLLESPKISHADSLCLAALEDAVRKELGVHFSQDD